MQLSVIIVNYNVPYFLEQCLYSTARALKGIAGEILVIDNCSTDESLAYLEPRFPNVRFIRNSENIGFGRANNIGVGQAQGEFILFLNPDTLVPEDCFHQCIAFMNQTPAAGALGVRMVDGKGFFLKESKRAFPDPFTSFYKLSGIAALFPHSPKWARYYLGHIPENTTSEVDVLAGAFMFVRKTVLDQTGAFDPDFFMYGEDVDLSYRIQKAGFKNYYFSETTIIHFKGESTRKGSMNYVQMFYQAMNIFVQKHYPAKEAGLFTRAMQVAIWGRAFISTIRRFLQQTGLPVLDLFFLMLTFSFSLQCWENFIRPEIIFDRNHIILTYSISCAVIWIVHFSLGMYDKQFKSSRVIKSGLLSGMIILTVYSLLPETLRFSRGIVVCSLFFFYVLAWIYRWMFVQNGILMEEESPNQNKPALVIGSNNEMLSAIRVIRQSGKNTQVLGRISTDALTDEGAVGNVSRWNWKSGFPCEEIICCYGESNLKTSIDGLLGFPEHAKIRYHKLNSSSIVGSDSRNHSGEALSSLSEYRLWLSEEKRNKRLVDVGTSLFIFSSWILLAWIIPHPFRLLKNSWQVLIGKKTWVGYGFSAVGLPDIAPCVITTTGRPTGIIPLADTTILRELDHAYARTYHFSKDIDLIRNGIYWLGS